MQRAASTASVATRGGPYKVPFQLGARPISTPTPSAPRRSASQKKGYQEAALLAELGLRKQRPASVDVRGVPYKVPFHGDAARMAAEFAPILGGAPAGQRRH